MDVGNVQKNNEFCNTYREKALNKIVMIFTEWFKDDSKLLSQIREVAIKLESTIHAKATCKEDYVAKIQQKMRLIHQKYLHSIAQSTIVVKQEQLGIEETSRVNIAEDNKPCSQLHVTGCTIMPPKLSLDEKAVYETQQKLLMDMYDEARKSKLPMLRRLQKVTEEGFVKIPSAVEHEKCKLLKLKVRQMIAFLTWKEGALKLPNDILRQNLNSIAEIISWYYRQDRSSQKQTLQQTSGNHVQITPSVVEEVLRKPETDAPNSQSHTALNKTPKCPSLKQLDPNSESMVLPRSKGKPRGRPASKHPMVEKRTTRVSDPKANLQQKSSIVKIEKPTNFGVTTVEREVKVKKSSASMGISGELVSATSSEFCDQSIQCPKSTLLPIERLTKAVMSIPSEVLEKAMNDISSAFLEMDELPKYAFRDESELSVNYYLVDYHQETNISTGDECMPRKRIKRHFDVKSSDAPTTSANHDSCLERPWKAANHDLVVAEVNDINKRMVETWVEVAPHSGSDPHSKMGTIVRCLYMPIAFSEKLRIRFVSIVPLSILSVEFLVPPHYPDISPIPLDSSRLPDGCSLEGEVLLWRAREMFDRSVRALNSIAEMVKAWDDCGRKTFTNLLGEKTFIDRYGVWRKIPAE